MPDIPYEPIVRDRKSERTCHEMIPGYIEARGAVEVSLLDIVSEVISNGDDAHYFRETALETLCYAASWLRKEGFWQAADVLISEVNGDYRETP